MSSDKYKKVMRVLFIDDQEMPMVENLRNHGYNVFHKEDINTLEEIECMDFHLIFCDIKGVGKSFSEEHQGAELVRQIKDKLVYPAVIAYSATGYLPGEEKQRLMRIYADDTIMKDAQTAEYIESISKWGETVFSNEYCVKALAKLADIDIKKANVILNKSLKAKHFNVLESIKSEVKTAPIKSVLTIARFGLAIAALT